MAITAVNTTAAIAVHEPYCTTILLNKAAIILSMARSPSRQEYG
jgi:hypothetical protein